MEDMKCKYCKSKKHNFNNYRVCMYCGCEFYRIINLEYPKGVLFEVRVHPGNATEEIREFIDYKLSNMYPPPENYCFSLDKLLVHQSVIKLESKSKIKCIFNDIGKMFKNKYEMVEHKLEMEFDKKDIEKMEELAYNNIGYTVSI